MFLDALEVVTTAQKGFMPAPPAPTTSNTAAGSDAEGKTAPGEQGIRAPLTTPACAAPLHQCCASVWRAGQTQLDQYHAIVSDLASRAVHCCYGGHWPSRLGGIAALRSLVPRLSSASLPRLAPVAAKAVFAVLRTLPEHSAEEQELAAVLQVLLSQCGAAGGSLSGTQQACIEGAAADTSVADAGIGGPMAIDSAAGASVPDAQQLPALLKQMKEIFVQQLLSSRSSLAARTVASAGLEVRDAGCFGRPACRS